MEKIAITRSDGSVAIMTFLVEGRSPTLPSGAVWFGADQWAREPSFENIQAEVSKTFDDAVSWRRVDVSDIPADRIYRDALVDTGKLEHDIEKAKEIQRNLLRHGRAQEFPELDAMWMKAIASGDTKTAQEIEAKRQALRDAPADPRIEAAATLEELAAVKLPE